VKILADELNLPVIQPRRLSEPNAIQQLQKWSPQLIVVAAFGQILKPAVLDLPEFGCINVHASLLPRWRGAAPIQAAILNGDEITGITIMRMDPGIDTGPILSHESFLISPGDTSASLSTRLANMGAELLSETLPAYLASELIPYPQDDSLATYAPMIKKEAGLLDFSTSAVSLERKIRAFFPWPGTYFYWNDQMVKVHHAHVLEGVGDTAGRHLVINGFPAIAASRDILILDMLQLAGKKAQSGEVFLQGARHWET
jgi:methionyl-tRNA formyltransferase